MPTFEITSPDGRTFEVTAPDGASQEQVMSYARTQYAQKPQAPNTAPNDENSMSAYPIAMGRWLTQMGRGVQQGYYGLTGNDAAQADLKAKSDEETKLYKPLADKFPLSTALGEGTLSAVGGPMTMAGLGALEYGAPEEKAMRAGAGFVGGKIGQGVANVIGRARPAMSSLFEKYGLNELPGQLTGNKPLQWITSTVANLPGGAPVRRAVAEQQQGLNSAAMGAMGAAGDSVTPETVAMAKRGIGQTFNQVPQGVSVAIDRPLASDLVAVEQSYYKNLSPDQRTIVKSYVDDILSHSQNGMPGDVYQKARSRISARANSTQDSELKTALSGVARALDDAFDRSATPAASDAMKEARAQWRAAKTIEPMAKESGDISAARLANGAKGMPGQLGDLAKLGESMRPLPMSGSAERLFYQSMLTGVPAGIAGYASDPESSMGNAAKVMGGSLLAPYLAALALTSKPTRAMLTRGLLDVSPATEKLLQRLGGSGGGLLGLSLSN